MVPTIAYYYQTNLGLMDPGKANKIIVSAIHFGFDNGKPYIHLNDWEPSDARYNALWHTVTVLEQKGVEVSFMMGGAGGAFQDLFAKFDTFYPLLHNFIEDYEVTELNLDVEERVKLPMFQRLMNDLKSDFPELKLTIAPVLCEVMNPCQPGAFSGFAYQDLFDTMGQYVHKVNVQMYGDTLVYENYRDLIERFSLDPSKLVVGMQSGDYQDKDRFDIALSEIRKMNQYAKEHNFKFGGCFVWEYFDAPPERQKNPCTWSEQIAKVLS